MLPDTAEDVFLDEGNTIAIEDDVSSEDEVNNPAARVYFGPLQSPEKKFASQATRRRSSRLSTTFPSKQNPFLVPPPEKSVSSENDEELEDVELIVDGGNPDVSEEVTPETEISLEDAEPSSALANRISRAHDNPSPPPPMEHLSTSPRSPDTGRLVDISFPTGSETQDPGSSTLLPIPASKEPTSPFFPVNDRSQPTLLGKSPSNPQDLISFDSIPTALTSNGAADCHSSPIGDLQMNAGPSSPGAYHHVNLLSPSPVRASKRASGAHILSIGLAEEDSLNPFASNSASKNGNADDPEASIPSATRPSLPDNSGLTVAATPSRVLRRSPRLSSPSRRSKSPLAPPAHKRPSPSPARNQNPQDQEMSASPTRKSRRKSSINAVRELGSLSPTSTGVLSNLLSLASDPSLPAGGIPVPGPSSILQFPGVEIPATPPRQPTPPSPSPSPKRRIQNVQRPPLSQSPVRSQLTNGTSSPAKFLNTIHDPSRTPARRVPVPQASAHKSTSPLKAPQLASASRPGSSSQTLGSGIFSRPVFSRPPPNDANRSPAKRIPVLAPSPSFKVSQLGSPVRPTMRTGSVEPPSIRKPAFAKPPSKAMSDSELTGPVSTRPRSVLPFPIRTDQFPEAIPEEGEPPSTAFEASAAAPSTTPSKVTLRQPSSAAGSRIPRIGAKPYARPVFKGKEPQHKLVELSLSQRRPVNNIAVKPGRLVKTGSGSSMSDDSSNLQVSGLSRAGSSSDGGAPSSPLKRKRAPEIPVASSPAHPQIVVMRQAVGMLGSKTRQRVPASAPSSPPSVTSPVKKRQAVMQMRKVTDDAFKRRNPSATSSKEVEVPQSSTSTRESNYSRPSRDAKNSPRSSPALGSSPEPPPIVIDEASPVSSPTPRSLFQFSSPDVIRPSPDPISLPPPPQSPLIDEVLTGKRRTTRVRKSPRPEQPLPELKLGGSRRRPTKPDAGTFPAMSAVALKAITCANTKKNQEYFATLETEVVRKEGNRPESPTTKVKTVQERLREEKERGRRERAERRARRSGEGMSEGMGDETEDGWVSEDEDEDDVALGPDGRPLRHRRGAGDDEDYVTPERPHRPEKRARREDSGEDGEKKRVKWDRGLFDTINLEDVKPMSRGRPNPTTVQRGALSNMAKTTRLDNLGNLLNVDLPLKGLVQESIVVKKFVYDNDEEAQVASPKPSSKGKGKKAK